MADPEYVSAVVNVLSALTDQMLMADGNFQLEQRRFWQDAARAAGEAFIGEGTSRLMNMALTQFVVSFAIIKVEVGFWRRLWARLRRKKLTPTFRLAKPGEETESFSVKATIGRDATGRWVHSWKEVPNGQGVAVS